MSAPHTSWNLFSVNSDVCKLQGSVDGGSSSSVARRHPGRAVVAGPGHLQGGEHRVRGGTSEALVVVHLRRHISATHHCLQILGTRI